MPPIKQALEALKKSKLKILGQLPTVQVNSIIG